MYRLTDNDVVYLDDSEFKKIHDAVYVRNDSNYHYLAFDRQLGGYSPLNVYVTNADASIMNDEEDIIKSLLARREICSLYPRLKLSLYPLTRLEGSEYDLDLENIDKHFADILKLNDEVYKTKYMFVNFGHGASNYNKELLLKHLRELKKKSKILEEIYIEIL